MYDVIYKRFLLFLDPCFYMIYLLCVPTFRNLDIEFEMTKFAFYYVGIGVAVFLLGYLQVSLPKGPHEIHRGSSNIKSYTFLPRTLFLKKRA